MTAADVKFFKEFSAKMSDALNRNIKNASQIYAKNIHNEAKDYLPGLTIETVRDNWLNTNSIAPAVQTEMVKVISPNGKPGSIPKENLKRALSEGYKEVK
jgi:hypothetical protein